MEIASLTFIRVWGSSEMNGSSTRIMTPLASKVTVAWHTRFNYSEYSAQMFMQTNMFWDVPKSCVPGNNASPNHQLDELLPGFRWILRPHTCKAWTKLAFVNLTWRLLTMLQGLLGCWVPWNDQRYSHFQRHFEQLLRGGGAHLLANHLHQKRRLWIWVIVGANSSSINLYKWNTMGWISNW